MIVIGAFHHRLLFMRLVHISANCHVEDDDAISATARFTLEMIGSFLYMSWAVDIMVVIQVESSGKLGHEYAMVPVDVSRAEYVTGEAVVVMLLSVIVGGRLPSQFTTRLPLHIVSMAGVDVFLNTMLGSASTYVVLQVFTFTITQL